MRFAPQPASCRRIIKAIAKAMRIGQCRLQRLPAQLFGMEQVIEIGPMSGKSNVIIGWKKTTLRQR